MLIEGRGEGGTSFDSVSADFLIYMYFFHSGLKKKTSKYSKASAVKNLKLSSSMWSYHCKKFGVRESLKKKSYKSEGEEVPSPSLPPPPPRPRTPLLDPPLSFFPIQRAFLIKCFFYIYFNRMHPPAPDWARRLSQDVVLSGYHVPTGVSQIVQCFWTRLHSSFY